MSVEQEDADTLRRQARHFFAIGVAQPPAEVIATIHDTRPSRLAGQTASYVTQKARESKHFSEGIDQRLTGLLLHGIADTQDLLHPHLRTFLFDSEPDSERARRFVAHPQTLGTIALLALRSEESMRAIIAKSDDAYSSHTQLDPHKEALGMRGYGITPASQGGCPFAGSGGEITPDRLFARFIQWSGELCIESILRHHRLSQ